MPPKFVASIVNELDPGDTSVVTRPSTNAVPDVHRTNVPAGTVANRKFVRVGDEIVNVFDPNAREFDVVEPYVLRYKYASSPAAMSKMREASGESTESA